MPEYTSFTLSSTAKAVRPEGGEAESCRGDGEVLALRLAGCGCGVVHGAAQARRGGHGEAPLLGELALKPNRTRRK